LFTGNESLKNVNLNTNLAIKVGDLLRLQCDYDLENAPLYSIKWYFGDDEFYRYVPKESPPTRVFPMTGVSVDVSNAILLFTVFKNSHFIITERTELGTRLMA